MIMHFVTESSIHSDGALEVEYNKTSGSENPRRSIPRTFKRLKPVSFCSRTSFFVASFSSDTAPFREAGGAETFFLGCAPAPVFLRVDLPTTCEGSVPVCGLESFSYFLARLLVLIGTA